MEGSSGRLIWRALLDGRANIGLALTGNLQARACLVHACFMLPHRVVWALLSAHP